MIRVTVPGKIVCGEARNRGRKDYDQRAARRVTATRAVSIIVTGDSVVVEEAANEVVSRDLRKRWT